MSTQNCLGCDVLMMASHKGDYCNRCRAEIKEHKHPKIGPAKQPWTPAAAVDQEYRNWENYRERTICFGKRKPRIYVRPTDG